MVQMIENPWRGGALPERITDRYPSQDVAAVAALLEQCPAHAETPLVDASELAEKAGVGHVWIKDERGRMGLGSFKALGAAYVIARDASGQGGDLSVALKGRTYVAASAGNHGMSVAAGARLFGARAVIYLAETVPAAFADRLREKGAEVVVEGAEYEASMDAAMSAAEANGWTLLADSSWEGNLEPAYGVMEGYLQMAAESARQSPDVPSHILLQAGVGGLAAAVAAHARAVWGDAPQIIVVEPEAAPALKVAIEAGRLVDAQGPVSEMGRLDCKTASVIALNGLARDADAFATLTEQEARDGVETLAQHGLRTTPSGGAALAALLAGIPGLPSDASVLCFLSEGPEDG